MKIHGHNKDNDSISINSVFSFVFLNYCPSECLFQNNGTQKRKQNTEIVIECRLGKQCYVNNESKNSTLKMAYNHVSFIRRKLYLHAKYVRFYTPE